MKRWPFRKRNSLGRLIDRTKQVLDDGTGQDNMQKLAALQVLEKQRQVMRVSFLMACSLYTLPINITAMKVVSLQGTSLLMNKTCCCTLCWIYSLFTWVSSTGVWQTGVRPKLTQILFTITSGLVIGSIDCCATPPYGKGDSPTRMFGQQDAMKMNSRHSGDYIRRQIALEHLCPVSNNTKPNTPSNSLGHMHHQNPFQMARSSPFPKPSATV